MRWMLLSALALAGCGPQVVYRDRVSAVSVPVAIGCAAARPARVAALRDRYSAEAWAAMTHQQKTAAVAAQALRRQSYGDGLDAATASCPAL